MVYFTDEEYMHVSNAMLAASELLSCSMRLIDGLVCIVSELAALSGKAYVFDSSGSALRPEHETGPEDELDD